jgi:hypothetical protein
MIMRCGALAALLAGALAAAACDEKLSSLTGPTPDLAPTFSSIAANIFEASDSSGRLACVQCHNANGAPFAANLNLQPGVAYGQLVGRSSTERPGLMRVAPGDPDASYLVHKLEGQADIVGVRMPRGTGPFLSDGQMAVIRRWIAVGAPNN